MTLAFSAATAASLVFRERAMREAHTSIALPSRRCERTTAVLEIQRLAIGEGWRIRDVTPLAVVATRGQLGAAFLVGEFLADGGRDLPSTGGYTAAEDER